jgi:uncharacterized protein
MDNRQPAIKWASLKVFLYLIAFIASAIIADIISVHLSKSILGLGPEEKLGRIMFDPAHPFIMIMTSILAFSVVLGTTVLFRKYIDHRSVRSMGFDFQGRIKDMFAGGAAGGGLLLAGFLILLVTPYFKIESMNANAGYLIAYFVTLSFAAMNEEIVFRGYILNNIMEKNNPYLALFISSLLFALLHTGNPNMTLIAFINLILAGLLLGIYYIHKKNLWFPFGMHLAWNFFQGPVLGFQVSGLKIKSMTQLSDTAPEWLTGGKFGFEGSILLTALMMVLVVLLHLIYREKNVESNNELNDKKPLNVIEAESDIE